MSHTDGPVARPVRAPEWAPHLFKARNASITNSGSVSSAIPAYPILAYSTAKAGLNHLMVSLAHALARKVGVNSMLIGTVTTPGYAAAGIDAATQEKMMHPDILTGRPGRPGNAALAMLWLRSPAGSWVSGQIITVHGGGAVLRLMGHGGRAPDPCHDPDLPRRPAEPEVRARPIPIP